MTVAELIERLRDVPGEFTVMADDREDGRYRIVSVAVDDYYGTLPQHVVLR
jgi:hypothetical protein